MPVPRQQGCGGVVASGRNGMGGKGEGREKEAIS